MTALILLLTMVVVAVFLLALIKTVFPTPKTQSSGLDPKTIRELNKTIKDLSKAASKAAKNGEFAERDRLDHARLQILETLTREPQEKFETPHDNYYDRYLK